MEQVSFLKRRSQLIDCSTPSGIQAFCALLNLWPFDYLSGTSDITSLGISKNASKSTSMNTSDITSFGNQRGDSQGLASKGGDVVLESATSLSQCPSVGIAAPPVLHERALGRGLAAPDGLSAPKALHSLLTADVLMPVIAIAGAAAAALIAVLLIRHFIIKRSLSTRVEYELLPSSTFDPTQEETQRFALQLTRTRPAESRMRPRRAASVRITLATDDDGNLGFTLSGPRQASSVLRHPTYSQVEMRALPARGESISGSFNHPG